MAELLGTIASIPFRGESWSPIDLDSGGRIYKRPAILHGWASLGSAYSSIDKSSESGSRF